ncbi:hypothetical protein M0D21_15980 [Aquimarina sp. D1M17]|uniref:hypothetical protein n=1 Tax=Aquimarina acroporae TaxID=2937283 RepID=UPI0020BFA561|nr:hypothetical protein [Aquimarina acroporae]MCK8523077.1 hypothetical protein [Aquimarina acroporae]
MPENQLYPVVSDIVALDKIPSEFEAVREAIEAVLGEVYFKDLVLGKSYHGEAGYYTLTLISLKPLGVNIPFVNDLKLVINPSNDGTMTEVPISFDYSWEVLKYFSAFSFDSFDNAIGSIFEILLELAGITREELLNEVLTTFFEDFNALESFITQFNTDNSTSLQVEANQSESSQLSKILHQIDENDIDFVRYIITKYVEVGTYEEGFDRLKQLLNRWYGELSSNFSEIIKIKFRFSMPQVSLGLLFPRKWLKPLDENYQPLPEPAQTTLEFNVGALEYSTQSGFEFRKENNLSLTRSEVANTGLIVEFSGLKLDLSKDSNVPEATADGRGNDFKGVYAQYAAVTLPAKWFDNEDNHPGTTGRLAGYDLLVGTGGISGKIALEVIEIPQGTITDFYSDCFSFQYPVAITSGGTSVPIEDYSKLLVHLNDLGAAAYTFDLPVTVIRKNGTVEQIDSQTAFSNLLNECEANELPPRLIKKFGKAKGFEIWFTSFDISFKQSKVIESNIAGGLKIPGLKDGNGDTAEVEIVGHMDDEGDFFITASEKDGFQPINIPQVLKIYIQSIEVGKEGDDFFLGTMCELEFTNPIMKKLFCNSPSRIALPKMRIYSDGSFEIVGGAIPVPTSFSLCLGPVDISVTNINFGSHQREYGGQMRKYNYWGFDGAISVDPLGFDVRGDGVRYYYTVDDGEGKPKDSYIHIKTVSVDLIIPGNASPASATAIINGYVSIPEPGVSKEYSGGISVKLPKAKIAGSAEMRFIPKYPAFIIDASMQIPVPIPIAATGLAFTGFRGLLGFRYVAEKEAVGLTSGEDTWYDYYVYPRRGVNIQKFSSPEQTTRYKNPVSIGAGATISTAEGGTIFSTRVMILLSIPSLFMIDGRASVLSKEYGLDDSGEPPFFAFLAYGDNSIEAGIGADFKLPQNSGDIIRLYVNIQAGFFFNNPSAWYINIGTRQKPNEARILDLVTVQAYLQLSAKGIEAGARAEFNFSKRFGPAKVKAWLFIEVGGKISFERPQIGGYIEAGGGLEVSFWVLRIGISFYAIFSAEAPKPFLIYAEVRVCGRIKIGFIKIRKCITAKIKWEKSKRIDKTPVPPLLPEQAEELVKGVSMLTGEGFELQKITAGVTGRNSAFDRSVLPLDSYIDIKFTKPVLPGAVRKLGGINNAPVGYTDLIPPQSTVKGNSLRQVKHKYAIKEMNIQAWVNDSGWEDYHPYEAVAKGADTNVNFGNLKVGHWQKTGKEYSKIRLLADNPFSFTEQGEPGWFVPEQLGITASSLFCQSEVRRAQCANWLNRPVKRRYYVPLVNPNFFYQQKGLYFQIEGTPFLGDGINYFRSEYAEISNAHSPYDFGKSLKIDNTNSIVLKFPNPSKRVTMKLTSTARGVNFRFYKAVSSEDSNLVAYELLPNGEVYKFSAELYKEFTFESETDSISKVIIDPETFNEEEINRIREEIEALFSITYDENMDGGIANVNIGAPNDKDTYDQLLSELEEAKRKACSATLPPPRGIGAMQLENTFIVGVDAFNSGGINYDTQPPFMPSEGEKCYTLLHEVCWLSVEDYEYNINIPQQDAIEEDLQESVNAISKTVDPIWRPNTKYRIHFKLSDTVDNETEHEFDYYYGFRTAGPIGHFHIDPKANYGDSIANPDQYPLTSLRNYIDYNRSYPNANGSLLQAKPLFYGTEGGNNEIAIFFTRPYVYHMLTNWESYKGLPALTSEMQIIVKDPIEKVSFSNPPETVEEIEAIPGTTAAWTEDTLPLMPEHHQFIANMLERYPDNCVGVLGEAIIPRSFKRTITITNLKPRKMYTAIVNNIFEGKTVPVHDFVFQTSRYKDFTAQVNSYYLKGENEEIRQALFDIPIHVTTSELRAAYSTVVGSPDAASTQKETDQLDWFDRVTEGILKIPPLDPPVTTEINVIKNTNGTIVGILVRNPEPFNDPKTPLDIITGTENQSQQAFAILNEDGTVDNDFKILYAKDYAQCIIMKQENTTIQITEPLLDFRFKYLRWNGNQYEVKDEVVVSDVLINNTL